MTAYLYVAEIFQSIDGEVNAFHQGRQTIFLRLSGCSLRCCYCDTKHTWQRDNGTRMTIKQVIDKLKAFNCQNITITGGEPLEQKGPLIQMLYELMRADNRYRVSIETNGSILLPDTFLYKISFVMDCKITDPQWGKMKEENWGNAGPSDIVKIVVLEDITRAIEAYRAIRNCNKKLAIAFSPAWDDDLSIYRQRANNLIEALNQAGIRDVIINTQLHKVLALK